MNPPYAMIVLHTAAGRGNRVAVAIDRLAWTDVVGTLARDDTILSIATRGGREQAAAASNNFRPIHLTGQPLIGEQVRVGSLPRPDPGTRDSRTSRP